MTHPVLAARAVLRTSDGWTLSLRRGLRAGRPADGPPVLFVPGYGMNASIFNFHPRGVSFMEYLYQQGLDAWSVDLRGTRSAKAPHRSAPVQLHDMAWQDLPAAIDHIRRATGRPTVSAIGCSLGGALLYAHVGSGAHHIDRLVTMGSPLIWQDHGPAVRLFGQVGGMLSGVPVRGTRWAARAALPLLSRVAPGLLSFYLNPSLTFTGPAGALAGTVENPTADTSRTLARWIREGRLFVADHDVAKGLSTFDRPLLVVCASGDGVCPPAASLAALAATGGPASSLTVDHPRHRVSHVDLFIGDHVHDAVYRPVAEWLLAPERAAATAAA